MPFTSLIREPSAFVPLGLSLAAFALILAVMNGIGFATPPVGPHDEGVPARLFQLLIGLQLPVIAYFAIKWLPRAGTSAIAVLMLQCLAAAVAVVTIVVLER